MSKKIIGVTVGTTLPKPNFKQTDPTKGDYIRNKPDFEGLKDRVDVVSGLVGDTSVSEQISTALTEANTYTDTVVGELNEGFSNVIYQMYGDDLTDDGAPTIRQVANDEVNTALESAKEYTDTKTSGLATEIYVDDKVASIIDTKMDKNNPTGTGSFSIGRKSGSTVGTDSFAMGYNVEASGNRSHAEGGGTKATGSSSHAEGSNTVASAQNAHAEGNTTTASASYSHAEGVRTTADGQGSHAEGWATTAFGAYSHAEGYSEDKAFNYITDDSTNEEIITAWNDESPFTLTKGDCSHAEGDSNLALGEASHAEGYHNVASGDFSHAEGCETTASGDDSHAEGGGTTASGTDSHAEGSETIASGSSSHAEGALTTASGDFSHAEGGNNTTASGNYSHAEGGNNTTASGNYSHAEGYNTTASGIASHTEGKNTTASKNYSHAEGESTTASGLRSHAEGYYTVASGDCSHAQGKYNVEDTEKKYAHIVGNGTSSSKRSNAHTIDWNGLGWFAGGLKVGGAGQDDGATEVALKTDIVNPDWNASEGEPGYIANRTHWEKVSEITILAETAVQFSPDDGYQPYIVLSDSLEVGKTYKIFVDSVEYMCICYMHYSGFPALGDAGLFDGNQTDGAEPFLIISDNNNDVYICTDYIFNGDYQTAYTHRYFISEYAKTLHPLDQKYMPESVALKTDLPTLTAADDGIGNVTISFGA